MTRERAIEKAISEWLSSDGWSINDNDGHATMEMEGYRSTVTVRMDVASLAEHLDAELDRILADVARAGVPTRG